jgi:hypothetical protein
MNDREPIVMHGTSGRSGVADRLLTSRLYFRLRPLLLVYLAVLLANAATCEPMQSANHQAIPAC